MLKFEIGKVKVYVKPIEWKTIFIMEVRQVQAWVFHKTVLSKYPPRLTKNTETTIPIQDRVDMPKHDITNINHMGIIT